MLDGYETRLQSADRRRYGRPLIESDRRSFQLRFRRQLSLAFPTFDMTKTKTILKI
ncbi:MAG: hypothetical protein MJZ67_08675 [Bacteroidales bacterium]|nr:hypothetical protein [Bacteroidales bacterium]